MKKLLMVVDPQIDFISGSLPVPGAEEAMQALARHLLGSAGAYAAKVVTLDFHPRGHCSFDINGGQWPAHCQAHTQGAAIWPELAEALYESPGEVFLYCKGQDADREEYSVFQNAEARASIENLVRDMRPERIDICGLAGDICVLNTLRDGRAIFGAEKFSVLGKFSPSLDGGEALRKLLEA